LILVVASDMDLQRLSKEANWFMVGYLAIVHLFALWALQYVLVAKYQTIIAFFVWFLGIWARYHRWSAQTLGTSKLFSKFHCPSFPDDLQLCRKPRFHFPLVQRSSCPPQILRNPCRSS